MLNQLSHLLTAFPSKLIFIAMCSALFWLGGFCFLAARRFVLPVILSVYSCLQTHSLWPLLMLSTMGIFCLGYGEKSPLRHCFGNGWGRGVWGLLAASCLSLPLFLTNHLGIYLGFLHAQWLVGSLILLLVYVALNFTLENALKNIPQVIGDSIIGASFASILLLIH